MEPIQWTESFSVGVKLFDEQHKQLIGMINRLSEDPQAATSSETVSELLDAMTDYAQGHFEAEETLMEKHSYPQLREHTAQHHAFRRKTAELCMDTMNRVDTVPESLLEYLRDWLIGHILKSDMAYKPFFHELTID
jgi:hemerythrin-like metal-binding protein